MKNKKEKINLTKKLIKSRIIILSEPIDSRIAKNIITQTLFLQQDNKEKPIKVFINSPGGSASDGFAIYDILKYCGCPVYTYAVGLCASAAVLVYLSATKSYRFALPNAKFLLHQPSTAIIGRVSDIEVNAQEILKLRERYNKIVSDETGQTLEKISHDTDRDFWLTAEEAKEYGLIGKILNNLSEL
ncbi:MAG: ClpP family protease [Planctomycetota bacterium]